MTASERQAAAEEIWDMIRVENITCRGDVETILARHDTATVGDGAKAAADEIIPQFVQWKPGTAPYALKRSRVSAIIQRAISASERELAEALEALPLAAFDKDIDTIDAAEFVDNAGAFWEAMQKARAVLAKRGRG